MSVIGILHQLSDFSADWEKPQAAVGRFMPLDNSYFLGHCNGHVVWGGLFVGSGFRSDFGPYFHPSGALASTRS